jgi:ElaB/YqjD/DUF883 family membrane-anchored ribosome-binding protein
MEKYPVITSGIEEGRAVLQHAAQVGEKALDAVQDGAVQAASRTEKLVRKYPLASLGVAFGGGAAIGVLVYGLFAGRRSSR